VNTYSQISINEAYRLINHGPVGLVSTHEENGSPDIAPIAWCCPIEMNPTQVLLVVDMNHKTFKNIRETAEFIVSVPHESQAGLVRDTGAVSGSKVDKFSSYSIGFVDGNLVKGRIPTGCIGYMECKLVKCIERDGTALLIGECVYAGANKKAFRDRVLVECAEGKTLHHLGGKLFSVPGDVLK
jgi:flavin reductase (DIM6/NTAB) family NADH-FMN oxidoreductase RutF